MKNPITGQEFERRDEFVEDLANSFVKLSRESYAINQEISQVYDEIFKIAGTGTGTETLLGTDQAIKVTKRLNVTYPRDKGEEHPLKRLMEKYPELKDMVRIEYVESGNKISKIVGDFNNGKMGSLDRQLVKELIDVREVKQGKAQIKIEDRK